MKVLRFSGALLLTACLSDIGGLHGLFDLGPIEHVVVFAPKSMHVGESAHASAVGTNSVGTYTHLTAARQWTVADSTIVSVRLLSATGDSCSLTALRAGVTQIRVVMEGSSANAEISVLE